MTTIDHRPMDGSIQNKTMLLGVDSLDATRGLVHKFLAVEEMFETEPGLADRVNFVQVTQYIYSYMRSSHDLLVAGNMLHTGCCRLLYVAKPPLFRVFCVGVVGERRTWLWVLFS